MNQGEEDDFGGFEAAEPVQFNAQNEAPGIQAAPNPWAAALFSPGVSGARNVQPDLLCGQNRFPQHLDTPPTADVAIAAETGPPYDGSDRPHNGAGFDPDLVFDDDNIDQLNLDQVSLANDILDGSFRSSNAQPGGAQGLNLPNISGLDLARDVSNSAENRTPENNLPQGIGADLNDLGASGGVNVLVPEERLPRNSRESSVSESSENRNVLSVSPQRGMEMPRRQSEERAGDVEIVIGGHGVGDMVRDSRGSNEETNRLKQDLEKQIIDNKKLSEDLARAHTLAEEAKKNYDELKRDHEKQLEELRQAGHQTLTVVVNEYKALLSTTVAQQQEMFESQFVERLKEEAERFQQILRKQKEEFDASQIEERRKNEEKLAQAVEEMRQLQQEKFDRQLAEEIKKFEKSCSVEIEKEKEVLGNDIEKKILEEGSKNRKVLERDKEEFQIEFAKEVERNKEQVQESRKEQNVKFQEELTAMLEEERNRGHEALEVAVQSTRDGMNAYLEEQRQRDRAQQRRQLASLDLFLESARQQLKSLMTDDNKAGEKEEEENGPS